jgi:hypothetical protein
MPPNNPAAPERKDWLVELQRLSASGERERVRFVHPK